MRQERASSLSRQEGASHHRKMVSLYLRQGQQQGSRLRSSKELAVGLLCRHVRMLLAVGSEGRARSSVHDRSSRKKTAVFGEVRRCSSSLLQITAPERQLVIVQEEAHRSNQGPVGVRGTSHLRTTCPEEAARIKRLLARRIQLVTAPESVHRKPARRSS